MIRTLTLGLALLAVLAAPAAARIDPPPDGRRTVAAHQDLRSPDARDAARGPDIVVVPLIRDRRPAPAGDRPPAAVGGFNWGDAALGSGVTAGLLLLLGAVGALALLRGRGESQHAARI